MNTVMCPICEAPIPIQGEWLPHELIDCPECGTELEVAKTDPPILTPAPEIEEDWGE